MNYVIHELTLYRHFLLVDSPIPFEFIANPTNYSPSMSDFSRVTGLDVCSRPSGCWRVDCWKLLPKEFQRNNPVFTMLLKYDADLLGDGETVDIRYSDIDVGEGVAGVNGQLVQILPDTFRPVVNSVDALQVSNHADLLGVKSSVDALSVSSRQGFIFNEAVIRVVDIGDVGRYLIPTFYASSPVALAGVLADSSLFFDVENFPRNYINKYSFIIDVSEVATPDGMNNRRIRGIRGNAHS